MRDIDLRDDIDGQSPEETRRYLKTLYDSAYKTGFYKPINSYGAWMKLFKHFEPFIKYKQPFKKILEVGCGTGIGVSFANIMGHNAWGIDLADASFYWKSMDVGDRCFVANALNLPFKDDEFDFVFSTDMLEHIPEHDIMDTLKEMRRVGSSVYFYIVNTKQEMRPLSVMKNDEQINIYTHITRKTPGWWANKLSETKYYNIDFNITDTHVVFIATKNKEQQREWRK